PAPRTGAGLEAPTVTTTARREARREAPTVTTTARSTGARSVGRMGAMGATAGPAGPAVDAARVGPQPATVGAVATWGGAGVLAGVGLVHLVTAPGYFEYASYLGLLFLANAAGAAVAALGLLGVVGLGAIRVPRAWGWGLGLLVAGGAFAAYVASNTV